MALKARDLATQFRRLQKLALLLATTAVPRRPLILWGAAVPCLPQAASETGVQTFATDFCARVRSRGASGRRGRWQHPNCSAARLSPADFAQARWAARTAWPGGGVVLRDQEAGEASSQSERRSSLPPLPRLKMGSSQAPQPSQGEKRQANCGANSLIIKRSAKRVEAVGVHAELLLWTSSQR